MSGSRKCLYIGKDFSGTDIYYSDIKNALVLRYLKLKFFWLLKIFFQHSQNFLRRNACEIENFFQFVEKMEKLKLGLSKQHSQMLKIKEVSISPKIPVTEV